MGPGDHTQPPIHGVERGSFRLGPDILKKLGGGSIQAGAAVAAGMFSVEPGDDATIIHPDVIRDIGHGDARAGMKVLQRFVQTLRRQPRNDLIEQPDGHSPDRIIR